MLIQKSKDLVVLMAWHHETNSKKVACYEENKKTFQLYNPDLEIITVINPYDDPQIAWLSTDLSIFHWYKNNDDLLQFERYLIVEWDCWCDIDLKDLYKRVWDCDVVGPCVKYPERDTWAWFNSVSKLPERARLYATGIVPFCGILVSKNAMEAIADEIFKPEYESINSELRFTTIATMLGFDPVPNPVVSRINNWKEPVPFNMQYKGLHHPRKTLTEQNILSEIEPYLNLEDKSVPKIIHQTWKNGDLPESMAALAETWKEFHPDWTYILWTDEMNREFIRVYFPDFLLQYDSYGKNIQRVDAVRYFILYKVGGLFIDTDFECLKNIEPLLADNKCIFALEPKEHCDQFKKEKIICNAFMAVAAGCDFFSTICKSLSYRFKTNQNHIDNILSTTGPFALTSIYDDYDKKDTITLLPSHTVYPLTVKEAHTAISEDLNSVMQEKIDNAYAVHYFFGTWY